MKERYPVESHAKLDDMSVKEYTESVTGVTLSGWSENKTDKNVKGRRMGKEQKKWDVVAPHYKYKLIEVRNMWKCLAHFGPSTTTGVGRGDRSVSIIHEETESKMEAIDSYVIFDLRKFPNIRVFEIPSSLIYDMWKEAKRKNFSKSLGTFSKGGGITQNRFDKLFPYEKFKLVAVGEEI